MDPKDPYRAANLIVQQFGHEARSHAAQRVLDMHLSGDGRGEAAWRAILDAVIVLEARTPEPGAGVH